MAALIVGVGYAIVVRDDDASLVARQAEVKSAGASVMPFDLDLTTHRLRVAGGSLRLRPCAM